MSLPAQRVADEPALKAAYMQQFAKFIEWPGDADAPASPRVFCMSDPVVADAADGLGADRRIGGRPAVVKRVQPTDDLRSCSILFVGGASADRIRAFLAAAKDRSIFTVGDGPAFTQAGGMLHFYSEQNRMRFAVNPASAQRAGLKLSSQFLSLATIIKDGQH
ncbi:MAG TPA: YfiR family protein [Vicinamibacterales bacterium]|nr:YfiR family protein [Vicinamibacterales bacterium]